jgi:hypothetical protein
MSHSRRTLLSMLTVWAGLWASAQPLNAQPNHCEGQLVHLQAEATLPFAGPNQVSLRTDLFMMKVDGQPGIDGDWVATRMIQTSTFTPPLPAIPGGYPVENFTIPAPGAEQTCDVSWKTANTVLVADCTGEVPYRIAGGQIVNTAANMTVGTVNNGVLELDLYITAGFPVLTGRPGDENTAIAIGLGARAIAENQGARHWMRLVIQWNTIPRQLIGEVTLHQSLLPLANQLGLTANVTDIQTLSDGTRQLVADFDNLAALPEPILDEEIVATLDWGQCEVERRGTIRDMLPFGLPGPP